MTQLVTQFVDQFGDQFITQSGTHLMPLLTMQ